MEKENLEFLQIGKSRDTDTHCFQPILNAFGSIALEKLDGNGKNLIKRLQLRKNFFVLV